MFVEQLPNVSLPTFMNRRLWRNDFLSLSLSICALDFNITGWLPFPAKFGLGYIDDVHVDEHVIMSCENIEASV
jgi:hypothetical protein